ncbi:MAG TPA: M48 family metallopeptidase [Phycisphaerales bacterium]|nr:M48 family metallopeptidase [Phycisphaerales bacterium]
MSAKDGVVLQLWLIALLAIVYIHDEPVRRGLEGAPVEFSAAKVALVLVPYLVLAGVVHLACAAAAREMDRRGSLRAVDRAERVLSLSRGLTVLLHGAAVFSGGWLEQVRAAMGNWIMLDEIVAVLPPLLTIVAGWWSYYPIEARLRESMWVRVLEEGHPSYPTPSRWQFVWSNIRHQMFFILIPLVLIGAWNEEWRRILAHRGEGVLGEFARWVRESPYQEPIQLVGQLGGVLIVLAISPLLMRAVWDALPLEPGALRDRLMSVCTRAGVRIRGLLVWRTHGTMLNGVAMGLAAPLRYILLTDALLDQLPERQVESVMAHEVGHAKYHHIPWILCTLLASMGLAAVALFIVALVIGPIAMFLGWPAVDDVLQVLGGIVMMLFAIATFGWVSRQFEWQADAFAAKVISRESPANSVVTQESVDSMCSALEAVSRLNHMPMNRWSFRHGSMTTRQERLRTLVGMRLDRLPIDRTCRWIKTGIIVGMAAVMFSIAVPGLARSIVDRPRYEIPDWYKPRVSHLEDAP